MTEGKNPLAKIWLRCVQEAYLEEFGQFFQDLTQVMQSILHFGKSVGLEMSGEDVEELVDEHNEDVTKKLQDIYAEVQQMAGEEVDEDKYTGRG